MKMVRRLGAYAGPFMLLLFLSACTTQAVRPDDAAYLRGQALHGLPYHPLVHHLDLSILAYHLYGQSLLWPFDPYYEDTASRDGLRDQLKKAVHDWARAAASGGVEPEPAIAGFRGPGSLAAVDHNPRHDPIIYRYDRLRPWNPSITNADGMWTEYLTPSELTDPISEVRVCFRPDGTPFGTVESARLDGSPTAQRLRGRDRLLVFEGGTGDKGEPGQPASQSLMGFALVRFMNGSDDYDVHIAFRGSRSGSTERALWQSFSDREAGGNPDWITDLGYNQLDPETGAGRDITTVGTVNRGFATSMRSILPQLFGCIGQVPEMVPGGRAPQRLFVTGHSLGGALAQHFVSAVLLGERFGPHGQGPAMPATLGDWPWQQLKLITYGAPRAGNGEWAQALSLGKLRSKPFSTMLNPYDSDALALTDPGIVTRLVDPRTPAAFRVLISTDPITTEKLVGGKHVGRTVYVNDHGLFDMFSLPDVEAHEPENIRRLLVEGLDDPRIPGEAWRYLPMAEVNPERDDAGKGSRDEYRKLIESMVRYHREHGRAFDEEGFRQDASLFLELLDAR